LKTKDTKIRITNSCITDHIRLIILMVLRQPRLIKYFIIIYIYYIYIYILVYYFYIYYVYYLFITLYIYIYIYIYFLYHNNNMSIRVNHLRWNQINLILFYKIIIVFMTHNYIIVIYYLVFSDCYCSQVVLYLYYR